MATDSGAVRKARIVWLAVLVAAPLYCAVALVLAMQDGGPVIDWGA